MRRILLPIAALVFAAVMNAESIDTAKLDLLFDRLTQHNLAGGSVAISSHGKVIYQRDFGRDQATGLAYRIGSITKVFTAVMVYQLVDEHRLALDDTLAKFFPQLPEAGKVTIAQLLGHRSGLADFTRNTGFDDWKDQPKTPAELLALIQNRPRDFAPDAQADYNNSNYLLLGYIVEKVTGQPYAEALATRVLRKAGLSHTYCGSGRGFQSGEAKSFKYFDGAWQVDRAVSLQNFGGAGVILSTPADLAQFITSLFAGKLISRQSLARMTTLRDGYGAGLFPFGDKAHVGFGHGGKTEGFGASLQYYPDSGLAIAYCTNAEVYPKEFILDDVFRLCFQLPCTLPTFVPIVPEDSVLQPKTGTYVSGDGNIRMVITAAHGQLLVEFKGRLFPFVALSEREFWNVPFGFFLEYSADGRELKLCDVDAVYELKRP